LQLINEYKSSFGKSKSYIVLVFKKDVEIQ